MLVGGDEGHISFSKSKSNLFFFFRPPFFLAASFSYVEFEDDDEEEDEEPFLTNFEPEPILSLICSFNFIFLDFLKKI